MTGDAVTWLQRGRAALGTCAWDEAQRCFTTALADGETPEALDGLGQAHYWQGRYDDALRLRERAYLAYRERGDTRAAAYVAVQLAQLHGLIHGNAAALNGWVAHARRLVDGDPDCVEAGWVELFLGVIAPDPVERERRTTAALDLGRRLGSTGLEYDALGYLGKAKVELGAVAEGMRLLDEAAAAASSGLVDDPWAAGEIWCSLFHACEMTVDVRRAQTWLGAVDGYVNRTGELPISAICRMHYGGLLTAAGQWAAAEEELAAALDIYEHSYTGTRHEPLLRLADLRVRQGRLDEAAAMLADHRDRAGAGLPWARLLLDRGEADVAGAMLDRELDTPVRAITSAPLLALAVEVDLARSDRGRARRRRDELARLADASGEPALIGLTARADAQLAHEPDALPHLQAAVAAFADAGLTHDLARARLDLAGALGPDRPAAARAEAEAAREAFARIGCARGHERAVALLRDLDTGDDAARDAAGPGGLTPRQLEVLALVADGLSNAEIADHLVISPRTAEHHVSNILLALGLQRRTEAAAWALRTGAVSPRR